MANYVDVGMPASGDAGYFDNEAASGDVVTPESSGAELAEGFIEEADHAGEGRLVADVEGDSLAVLLRAGPDSS